MKLIHSPLFKALPTGSRASLAGAFQERELAAGTALWRVDEPADSLAIVLSGQCELSRPSGDQIAVLGQLGPGTLVGSLTLLSPSPRAATLRALVDSRVAELPGRAFRNIWRTSSPTAIQLQLVIARTLAQELRDLDHQLTELMHRPAVELQDAELRHVLRVVDHLCEASLRR